MTLFEGVITTNMGPKRKNPRESRNRGPVNQLPITGADKPAIRIIAS